MAYYENSNSIGEILASKEAVFIRCLQFINNLTQRLAKPYRWAITAGHRCRMSGVFQFVGFDTFPEPSPQTMESFLEVHAFSCSHGFDLRENR